MRDFLVFRLSGPMSAFGDITVGERRSIWNTPSKSAVLGLVAGALGIVREDATAHQALEVGLGFAVRVDAPGLPLRDYHTAQAPKARRNARWRTRREELADKDELNTVLSERFYRLEADATVALWRKAGDTPALETLGEALMRPRFTPYLGRKACPLGRAPRPRVVEADGLLAALDAYGDREREADLALRAWFRPRAVDRTSPVWFEMDAGLAAEETLARSEGEIRQRRDSLRDRSLWRFSERREGRLTWHAPIFGQEDAA
jgi:CRISPR system Cascade subunit CasD